MAPAAVPWATWPSSAAVGVVILAFAACPDSPGQAQDAGSTPTGEIPTVEGTRDATVPLKREDAGGGAQAPVAPTAMPPAALGTLSSWRKSEDRSAIRIGSEFGADELLGAPVVDREGHAVGTIEDLLIDTDGMVRKAIVRAAPEASGSRSAVVDLLQLRKRDGGDGFVVDEVLRDMRPASPLGSRDSPGAAGTGP